MEVFTGKKPFIELSRDELLKIKNQEAFIPIIYSHIVGLLKNKYGNEKTLARLREMGYKLADGLLKHWVPKNTDSITDLLKETYKFLLYRSLDIHTGPAEIIIQDHNCPVCYFDISDSEIPFCVIISALVEKLINVLRLKNPRLPKVECTTQKSRSMGSDYCEHIIKIK